MLPPKQMGAKLSEQSLVELIDRTAKLIHTAETTLKKQDLKIVLLVGDTGAGKSTIFNLLCGAEFEIETQKNRDELKIRKGTKNYSLMKSGTQSITKEPIYFYHEKYQHLIIDFPGFKDTSGELDQLVIQLLFNKIISNKQIKLLYIIQQPLFDLPNRGAFIQEFIREFSSQKVKFHQCTLVVNSFTLEDKTEAQVIEEEKKQLCSITKEPKANSQQIFVIRQINKKRVSELPEIQKRLWQAIILAFELLFQPFKIEKTEVISKYLTQTCHNLLYFPCSEIQRQFHGIIDGQNVNQLERIKTILNQANNVNGKSLIMQVENIHLILDQLHQTLFGKNIRKEDQFNFLKIFNFFNEYKAQIVGFDNCLQELNQTINIMKTLTQSLDSKINQLEQQKRQEEERKIEKIKMEQQFEAQQKLMLEEIERIKQQEAAERQRQIDEVKKEAEKQQEELRKRIPKQQSSSGCQLI